MGLKDRFEHLLGLGVGDEPRRVAVEAAGKRVDRAVVSTPGARVRIVRPADPGELQRVLLWCLRRGVPVQLAEGPAGLFLDGRPIEPAALRAALDR